MEKQLVAAFARPLCRMVFCFVLFFVCSFFIIYFFKVKNESDRSALDVPGVWNVKCDVLNDSNALIAINI